MKRTFALLGALTVGLVLAVSGPAWANGEEFFAAAKDGKVDLVYYGRIKDKTTGRTVPYEAVILLRDKATGLSFPFTNDKPGHYRSPDVGAAIKEIGEKVDVNAFEMDLQVVGYKRATVTRVPRKASGTVEVDFALEPLPGTVTTAGVGRNDSAPYTLTILVLLGTIALFFIVRAARTSNRLPTTAR